MHLMKKFDGKTYFEEPVTCIKRRYRIKKLPDYLFVHIKRFSKNEFFLEKNPTILNFPIKSLDLSDFVHVEESDDMVISEYKYDLLANVIHEGKPESGTYRVQVRHNPTDEWFDI